MVYIDINKSNYKTGNLVQKLDHYMGNPINKIFILIYMEGCDPCSATRPEWEKLNNVLSKDFLKRDNIIIASIDHQLAHELKNLTSPASRFPTMRFITDRGKTVENYEDSGIEIKDRTIDSFIEWIKFKTNEPNITVSEKPYISEGGKSIRKKRLTRRKNKNKRGGKWSLKYKRSINCRKPRGFSQKQHCKYGRKN